MVDPALADFAQAHSQAQADERTMRHSGGPPFYATWGENVGYGQTTTAEIMNDWLNSPGHRANIENCSFTTIGVGLAYAGTTPYWTQDFGG